VFLETRSTLPASFWNHLPDPVTRAHARMLEQWAIARGLGFGKLSSASALPTWLAFDPSGAEAQPIVSLQAEYTMPGSAGRRRRKGVPDVPFHRLSGNSFLPNVQQELLRALEAAIPGGKRYTTGKVPKWWPFTWRALAATGRPGDFISVLDGMLNGHCSASNNSAKASAR
jgi:hypothetical protein